MRHIISRALCVSLVCGSFIANAQSTSKVEYFWDNDPGYGNGTVVSATTGDNNVTIDFSKVDCGVHTLWIRAQDNKGNWSQTIGKPILINKNVATTISKIEYFWDKDPGYDKATPINAVSLGNNECGIDISDIETGAHLFCLRAKDDTGEWSTVISKPIYIFSTNPLITAMEYFIDSDPGEENGIKVDISSQSTVNFTIDTDALSLGNHQLNVRIKDCYGKWSVLSSEPFEIIDAGGVESVEFTMPIKIYAENGTCVLRNDNLIDSDSHVTIVAVDGRTIASTIWNSSCNTCEINIGITNQPIFVIIEQDGNRLVKRIMAQ